MTPQAKSSPKNRNALRSKRLLAQALSELILEMPYSKITVAAIAKRADLNRGTFYAHYNNVDDLMTELLEDIMKKLFSVIDEVEVGIGNFPRNPEPIIEKASAYLLEEYDLYSLLVASDESNTFLANMKRSITKRIHQRVIKAGCHKDNIEAHVAVVFVASGLVDIYLAWLRGEYGNVDIKNINSVACALSKAALKQWA